MNIPVVVVDDQEVDRYLVKRRLAKADHFDEPVEISNGESLLQEYFSDESQCVSDKALLLLIDINMPGLDGFDTLAEIEHRMRDGKGPLDVVVLMITSSGNINDKKRAEAFSMVKGFISKPLDIDGVQKITDLYLAYQAEGNS